MMTSEHTDPRTSTVILEQPNRTPRLVFCALSRLPADNATSHFFTVDDIFRYEPFFNDFGPLNINLSYKFCQMLIAKLAAPEYASKTIYFYCFNRPQNKANAAVLIGIYLVVYQGRTSAAAYEPLKQLEPYMPFRDASQGICTFRLAVQHCLRAVAKAQKLKFFDFDNWNSAEYEHFESVENGDLNIAIPKKFLLFSGPHSTNVTPEGYPALTPADYLPIFQMYGVSTVIRLNKKCYERRDFLQANLAHHDLYHADGSTPSNAIAEKFIAICEQAPGTIAVHCKAGLGRTGTCIGLYIMKHYHFSAAETIAWLRLCRPGAVIGPQQHFLKLMEPRMWKLGKMAGTIPSSASSVSSLGTVGSSAAGSGQATPARVQSSDGVHHPAPTPSYAMSQPSSPLSLNQGNSNASTPSSSQHHASYSQSFDAMPTMNQQKISAQYRPASSAGLMHASAHSNGASSSSTPSSSSSYPHTRSAARAAIDAAANSPLNPVIARGRSKAPRVGSSTTAGIYADDAKDSSAPLSAPQPLRSGSVAKQTLKTGSTVTRSLFDQKSWLTSPSSPAATGSPSSSGLGAAQRRSPSANGLRRGPTSPIGNPLGNLSNTLVPSPYGGSPTSLKSTAKRSASQIREPSASASSSSSPSAASAIQFRQTKVNARTGKA